jgi:mannose-6-phosphate isomerase-like protein (cupin superfamily)
MSSRLVVTTVLCLLAAGPSFAQTPAPQAPPPDAPKTAPQPAPRRRAASPLPTTVTLNVTDPSGAPIGGVKITAVGATTRETTTVAGGVGRFLNVKPGDYRLRFEHEGFVTLERDVTVKGGSPLSLDAVLTLAPAPPKVETPAPVAKTNDAPPGDPRTVTVVDFVEKNFIGGRDPQKEDQLGCTASAKTTLLQVREDVPEKAQADADEVLYVVAGEGTLRLGNKDVPLSATTLAVVPRGTVRALSRRGKNPLILLSIVSGPACTK